MASEIQVKSQEKDKAIQVLVTGARGFIGKWVVSKLLDKGLTNIRCLVRPSSVKPVTSMFPGGESEDSRIELIEGNLLSRDDCLKVTRNVAIIYHLAAGRGDKAFPSAYQNSVVTTRNLLEAGLQQGSLIRFVNVSSFTVYSNRHKPRWRLLDETCPIEKYPAQRGNPYCFAKVKQEEMVFDYANKRGLKYVNLRPGIVYGPGNEQIYGRVGVGTFGLFLHLGGSNTIPLTYVENCADAIVLAGLVSSTTNETYNVIDDDLPTSRRFLGLYKKNVKSFPSIYLPHALSHFLCYLWEKYSSWSRGQLPNSFNRKEWHAYWKKTNYTNAKIKHGLGWVPKIHTSEGLQRYLQSCRDKDRHA